MRIKIQTIVLSVFFASAIVPWTHAQETESPSTSSNELIAEKMGVLERSLSEVRRDQLNYQIERDLLREMYSSNLQIINVVIAMVLGIFTIVGFLGVRSIGSIRKEFSEELDQLRKIRTESEIRLAEIESHQRLLQKQLEDVSKLNIEQEQRLKLLEIQEKASSFLRQEQYQRTLDYVAVGLEIDPNDITLLQLKSEGLMRLNRFDEVRLVLEKLVEIDPQSENPARNLCEVYLLLGLRDEFDKHSAKYSSAIRAISHLAWYFQAVVLYKDSKEDGLRNHVIALIENLSTEKKRHMAWRFDEVRSTIDADETSPMKNLFLKTLDVLRGDSDPSELGALVEEGDNEKS